MDGLRTVIRQLDGIFGFTVAYAHCDVPCGIYDPHAAQVAAHTVVRMDMLIADVTANAKGAPSAEDRNKFSRYVLVKEQHAEIVKHEVQVLWSDYFKVENAPKELHDLVWSTLKLASKAKQSTDIKTAEDLLESVQKVAEAFWASKKVQTVRVKSFYPTEERTIVYPKV